MESYKMLTKWRNEREERREKWGRLLDDLTLQQPAWAKSATPIFRSSREEKTRSGLGLR